MNIIHLIVMCGFFVAVIWFVWCHIAADLPADFLAKFVNDAKKRGGK
ncbi:hypothetical protein O3297_16760 [Janthinobacterium sp. SUN128]|nr:hypothetical protein [Janthinobacterium sp. SUN128]MDO8035067.1 hypothetical protein [Janthinobacterium sp. SUN128]